VIEDTTVKIEGTKEPLYQCRPHGVWYRASKGCQACRLEAEVARLQAALKVALKAATGTAA
jgi:hypothetical protein